MNFPTLLSFPPRLAAVVMVLTCGARADTVPAPAAGDVFAGFRASGGQGASTSYLIKLGPDTIFRTAVPGASFDISGIGNPGSDLTATYGANWHTRADVTWAVFAVRPGVNSTVYGSRGRTAANTVAPAWPVLSSAARNGTAGAITSVLEEVGGYKGRTATANNPAGTFQTNAGTASSYNFQVGTPGTSDFGSLSQWTSIETGFGGGPAGAVLDFFRIGTAVTHTGSFSIDTAGTIRFSAPAPATGDTDTDGDGFTDAQETLAGTDPASAADFFQTSVTLTEGGPRIQTPKTAANRTYTIEYAETLGGAWAPIGTHQSGAAALAVDFTDNDPVRRARSRGFYRVRVSS